MMKQSLGMQRFTAILEAYGSEPSRWPEKERHAMLQFIAANPQTKIQCSAEAQLDQLLDSAEIDAPSSSLVGTIMASLPNRSQVELIDTLLAWLFPASNRYLTWLWRPAVAVTLPLAIGFILGAGSVSYAGVDEWDSWQEEIYISAIISIDSAATAAATTSGEHHP